MAKEHIETAIKQLGGPLDDYWRALGCFANAFGLVERWLIEAVRRYGQIAPDPARIVMGGTRIDTAMDYLRRFIEIHRYKGAALDLLGALEQLGHLNKVRNDIFHYGRISKLAPSDSSVVISNITRAKTAKQIRQYVVSVDHLQQMIADTVHVTVVLRIYALSRMQSAKYRARPDVQEILQWPWLYKPPTLLPPDRRLPKVSSRASTPAEIISGVTSISSCAPMTGSLPGGPGQQSIGPSHSRDRPGCFTPICHAVSNYRAQA